jgi:tripartite-type tricarboxylate transporter receptor subunit TctC
MKHLHNALALLAALLMAATAPASAQTPAPAAAPAAAATPGVYPDRAIKMLVPLGAGSAVDVVLRVVAEKMQEILGQPIVVENQAGAAGLIGMRAGSKAKPDGYTLLGVNDSVMTMLPNMHAAAGYDPLKDFVPVTQLVLVNWALVAHPSVGVTNVAEMLAKAKAAPDTLTFASGGIGSPQHVAMEIFMKETGIKLRHVPYKGAAQGLNDVVSGHVNFGFIGLPTPNEFIKTGQLKLIGQATVKRLPMFADSPTLAEGGVKDFSFFTSGSLLVPAGTPQEIVAKLNKAAVDALKSPAVAKKLVDLGYDIVGNGAEAFAADLKSDFAKMGAVIKAAGIKVE